jgi:hypothetical protein
MSGGTRRLQIMMAYLPSSSRKVGKAEVLGAGGDAWVQQVSSQTLHPEVVEVQASVSSAGGFVQSFCLLL